MPFIKKWIKKNGIYRIYITKNKKQVYIPIHLIKDQYKENRYKLTIEEAYIYQLYTRLDNNDHVIGCLVNANHFPYKYTFFTLADFLY